MSEGDDLRKLPLSMRKANLARLSARRINGIFLSDFERGEIDQNYFAMPACCGSRAWSPSATIALIVRAFRLIG
jgi:hypothetical protein